MTDNRLRYGALAWLLTLQFFVVETVVALGQVVPYSWTGDVISALGASASPGARWMNASFVVQGFLVLSGALALRPLLRATPGRATLGLFGVTALGSLMVGVFPLDGNVIAHQVGAGLYFVGSTLGLIALAYGIRHRSEGVGTVLAVLGLIGVAATIFFATGVTGYLGTGGTERAAAYVLPIGLALAGVTLWRQGDDPAMERERERARAERQRTRDERDAALEAAALRSTAGRTHAGTAGASAADGPDATEDHWAPVRRED